MLILPCTRMEPQGEKGEMGSLLGRSSVGNQGIHQRLVRSWRLGIADSSDHRREMGAGFHHLTLVPHLTSFLESQRKYPPSFASFVVFFDFCFFSHLSNPVSLVSDDWAMFRSSLFPKLPTNPLTRDAHFRLSNPPTPLRPLPFRFLPRDDTEKRESIPQATSYFHTSLTE